MLGLTSPLTYLHWPVTCPKVDLQPDTSTPTAHPAKPACDRRRAPSPVPPPNHAPLLDIPK